MKQFFKKLFTEKDNQTPDIAKILATISIINSWIFQGIALYKNQPFDIQAFGVSQGAIFAGVGVALGLKKETEVKDA